MPALRHRQQAGFTLFELMIAVLVIALTGVLAFGDGGSHDEDRADAAASEVADAYRFARDESLRTGLIFGVHARASAEGVRVFRLDTATNPPSRVYDVYDPVAKQLWDTLFDGHPVYDGVDLERGQTYRGTCNADRFIAFRDGGTPSCTDPLAVLLERADIALTYGGATRTVSVDGFSGRVSVQ